MNKPNSLSPMPSSGNGGNGNGGRKSSILSSPPKSPRNNSGVPSGAKVLTVSDLRNSSKNNKAALKKRRSGRL